MLCYFTASDIIVVLRYFMDSATVMAEFRLTQQVIVASPTVPRKFWDKAQLTRKYKNLSFPAEKNCKPLFANFSNIWTLHT